MSRLRREAIFASFALAAILAVSCGRRSGPPSVPPVGGRGTPPPSKSTTAPPRRVVGLNGNPRDSMTRAKMREIGATRMRTTLYWTGYSDPRLIDGMARIYPDGSAPWHTYAEWWAITLAAADSAGFETLILINSPPFTVPTLADGIAEAPRLMAGLARLYPGRTWQFLNEMNGDDGFNNGWFRVRDTSVTHFQRGQWYASILAPVYDSVKAADPTARVVTGGITPEYVDFYRGMIAGGAAGKFDAVAMHFYGTAADQKTNALLVRAAIGPTMPLWITEFGPGLPLTIDQEQYDDLAPKLADNDSLLLFDRMYHFELMDNIAGLGLVHLDGTNRLAFSLLRARSRQ